MGKRPDIQDDWRGGKPLIPALLAAAHATDDANARAWTLSAVGKIDASTRAEMPEVDEVLKDEEKDQAWLDEANSGKMTLEDWRKALKDPKNAEVAATELGMMGPKAVAALPELIEAMNGQNKDGEEILNAIRKIDPQAALSPDDLMPIMQGTLDKLTNQTTDQKVSIMKLFSKSGSWCTRLAVNDFAKKLSAQSPEAGQAFMVAVLKQNPAWSGVFQGQ